MVHYETEDDDDLIGISVIDEDRDTLSPGRQALGLTRDYVPAWTPRDAFRELCQNWKDAIIETFGLDPGHFPLELKDSENEYIATVRHPHSNHQGHAHKAGPGELLGFILYSKDKGTLELTNLKAQLRRETLELGVTTKREKGNLAGTHGEGFKVAALVMLRNGYQVRYGASKYYWKFRFGGNNKRQLYCCLSPISKTKLEKQMEAYSTKVNKGTSRKLTANIWEDVSVKVGRVHSSQGARRIAMADFKKWLEVSIDLDRPSKVIETAHGNLILDPKFSGRVYLKGLLLESYSLATKFRFGYNLFQGHVNRDRQKLTNPVEEAEILASIWEEAIQKNEVDTLSEYVKMLREDNECADVNLAKDHISKTTASTMWQYLLRNDPERKRFYHDDRNGDQDVELIRKSLKKEPEQLPSAVWVPLRRFKLVRTPEEQRHHLLHNAPVSVVRETPYSASVKRALGAALALDTRTKDLKLVFKSGAKAELDLLLEKSNLLIHEKWLDFHASHDKATCYLSRSASAKKANIDVFSCDHIVTSLFELVLIELTKGPNVKRGGLAGTDSSLRLMVSEGLRQMPRKIEITPGDNPGEIEVSWTDLESSMASRLHGLNLKCRITLHRESTCSNKKFDLLEPNGKPGDEAQLSEIDTLPQPQPQTRSPTPLLQALFDEFGILGGNRHCESTAECGCPEQVVSQKDSWAVFRGLSPEEVYFPMVARTDAPAFFGLPPNGVRPKAPEENLPSRAAGSSIFSCAPQKTHAKNGGHHDLNDPFSSDNDDMETNIPHRCPQSQNRESAVSQRVPTESNPNRLETTAEQVPQAPEGSTQAKNRREMVPPQAENEARREQLNGATEDLRVKDQQLREISEALKDAQAKNEQLEKTNQALAAQVKKARDGQATMTAALRLVLNSGDSDGQPPATGVTSLIVTPGPSSPPPVRIKRERTGEVQEDSTASPIRVSKRARVEEVIDVSD